MTTPTSQQVYSQGSGTTSINRPVISSVDPSSSNTNYNIGQMWINESSNFVYQLTSFSTMGGVLSANWTYLGSGGSNDFVGLVGSDSTVVQPNGSGYIYVAGANNAVTTGNAGTHTLTVTSSFGVASFVVSPIAGQGNYTTVQSAIDAASSGDTIFICDGAYDEAITLKSGVTLASLEGSGLSLNVNLTGGLSYTGGGNVFLTNIGISTANATGVAFSGSSTGTVSFAGCFFNVTTNPALTFTNTSSSSTVNIYNSFGSLTSTDNFFFSSVSPGNINLLNMILGNPSGNNNPIQVLGANIVCNNCIFNCGFTGTNSATSSFTDTVFSVTGAASCITLATSATAVFNSCFLNSTSTLTSIVSGDDTSTITFNATGIRSAISATISGSPNIYLNSLFSLNSRPIDYGTATIFTLDQELGATNTQSFNCYAGISTNPEASADSAVSLGSAYQNTLGYDVVIVAYLSSSAGSLTVELGVDTTDTPTQQTIVDGVTVVDLNVIPVTIYLPNNYYALLSVSGTATTAITGQQAMAV